MSNIVNEMATKINSVWGRSLKYDIKIEDEYILLTFFLDDNKNEALGQFICFQHPEFEDIGKMLMTIYNPEYSIKQNVLKSISYNINKEHWSIKQ